MKYTNHSKKYWFLLGGFLLMIVNIYCELGLLQDDSITKRKAILYAVTGMSKIASSIGLALIVGFFTAKIKINEKLNDNVSIHKKSEIINELMVNGDQLDEFKKTQANNILNLKCRFRTNVNYHVNISIKKDENQHEYVVAETIMEYIEHNSKEDFERISTYFDDEKSYVEYIKVSDPKNINESFEYKNEHIHTNRVNAYSNDLQYESYCNINKKLRKLDNIHVEKKYVFIGQDHWITYGLIFQCPTNGVNVSITAENGLKIKESTFFDDTISYSKTQTSSNHMMITSNQWLTNHSGFLIVISK